MSMKFTYTIKILQKRIDQLQGEIAIESNKEDEAELMFDLVISQNNQENMKRDISELQKAIETLIKEERK